MDAVEVERRLPRARRHHRHVCPTRGQQRKQACLHFRDDSPHMAHRAVAKKRHRAMRDPPPGLDLGPPDTAMAKTDPVLVQRLRNDHMLHSRRVEPSLLGKTGDAPKSACFLVCRA